MGDGVGVVERVPVGECWGDASEDEDCEGGRRREELEEGGGEVVVWWIVTSS